MFIISFLLVAFGQAVFHPIIATIAAVSGYALFWTKRRPFLLAWAFGAGVQGVQLSWFATPEYQGQFIIVAYALVCLLMGLLFAGFNHFVKPQHYHKVHGCIALAGLWVLIEWARLFLFCGYAWNPAGLALGATLYGRQLASVGGVLLLSFAVMFINLLCIRAIQSKKIKALGLWAIAACAPFAFGMFRVADTSDTVGGRALLIQTGLYPDQKFPIFPSKQSFISLESQWDLALAEVQQAEWIIFPESAFPFGAHLGVMSQEQIDPLFIKHFGKPTTNRLPTWSNLLIAREVAEMMNAEVILGLDDGDYNAAFHVRPDGKITRWEKMRLLPIAECLPFEWLKPLAAVYGIDGEFKPGKNIPVSEGRVPIAVSICYDECFSHLVRKGRAKGAKLLLNLTNDAWYPHSRLTRCQFEHGRLRSVENGAPLIRVCNTGVTAALDCFGRTLGALEGEEKGSLIVDIPLSERQTLYSQFGDFPLIFSCFASGITFLLRCLKKSNYATLVERYQ
ncbi:MAG: apolipoprotein N-acyltransferase [Chlamydiales bacterium]|nr:apolipoprotein N-acyltransferase [Chlamydiales bacterium]